MGTGLIGGSVGLAVRRRHPDLEVVGVDPVSAARAVERGACTSEAPLDVAVRDADLVVLAAPVGTLPALLREVSGHVRPDALVTDVGSVKGPLARVARGLSGVRFCGGHPMAGAERGGVEHADALLFENAAYVLCPLDGEPVPPEARWLVEAVGARAVVADAERHDRLVATVSHLPQLLAVALVEVAADLGDDALALAAGGFRDMTRIASSPFGLWGDIYAANAPAVEAAVEALAATLDGYRDKVAQSPEGLRAAFEGSARHRGVIPADARGFLAPLADVVVWTADRPGALHAITGALADAGVDVKDIELMRVREGDAGTFRIGLADGAAAERAVEALSARGFRARRRDA